MPGVGPKTKAKLLTQLGSLKAVKAASVEELRRAGASRRQAEAVVRAFQGLPAEGSSADAERAAVESAFDDV